MSVTKLERLQLRIDDSSKRRLEEAAEAAHLSLTSFVLQAAQQRADEILADRALIPLDQSEAADFVAALDALPQVNPRLMAALQQPVKVDWVD